MKYYQIKKLSKLTSTTVRTLQYYDEIDLLKPSKRSLSGYRLYSENDLLRLQQIITLKYLGLSLTDIKDIIKSPNFNILKSLRLQAQILSDKAAKIQEASKLLRYIATQIEAGQAINWESTAVIINILERYIMSDYVLGKYQDSELGKKTEYDQTYNPERLYAIPRAAKRKEIGVNVKNPPFLGFDYWNHYEVSWLNERGKPIVATAEIIYDCNSPFLIESKSLKLYFNSFNNTKFKSIADVENTVKKDLEKNLETEVQVIINQIGKLRNSSLCESFEGNCIDNLDVDCSIYTVNPNFLLTDNERVEEILYSDLLRSNCLVTNQPDWGSVQIAYKGKKINREGLLRYIISYRNHNEFHEQCIERIFVDIMKYCKPEDLTVYGRYTRRGGLDINPYRSTKLAHAKGKNFRLARQ